MPNYKRLFSICCQVLSDVNSEEPTLLQYFFTEVFTVEHNREFILGTAPYFNGLVKFANYELKNDPDFMLAVTSACEKEGDISTHPLEHASPTLRNSRDFITRAIQTTPYALQFAHPELQNEKEIVMAAVRCNGFALRFASPALQNDRDIVEAAVMQDGRALQFANLYNANKQIVLAAVQSNGFALAFASPELQDDREVVEAAVQKDGATLGLAHPLYRANRQIVLAAVQSNGSALEHASVALRGDSEIVEVARINMMSRATTYQNNWALMFNDKTNTAEFRNPIKNYKKLFDSCFGILNDIVINLAYTDGSAFMRPFIEKYRLGNDHEFILAAIPLSSGVVEFASLELRNNPEFMLAAALKYSQNDMGIGMLEYLSPALKNSRSFIMNAIQIFGFGEALKFTNAALQDDRDVVEAAVMQDGDALEFASPELKNDREVVEAAVGRSGTALQFAHSSFTTDKQIVLAAVQSNGFALKFASPELQNDREVVEAAVGRSGAALQFAHSSFTTDKQIVLAAVQSNGFALQFAHSSFTTDKQIVLAAVMQDGDALKFASPALQNDREVVEAAVGCSGTALEFAHSSFTTDKQIVLAAVQSNGLALQFASPALQNDRDIVEAAIKCCGYPLWHNGDALKYASAALQNDPEIILEAVSSIKCYQEYFRHDIEDTIFRIEVTISADQKNTLVMLLNNLFAYNQFNCSKPRQHNAQQLSADVMRKVGDFLGVSVDKERQLGLARSVYQLFPGPRKNPSAQADQTLQRQAAEEQTPASLSLSR